MSTSDIELAVTTARRLESLLETCLGASGRGLHEKLVFDSRKKHCASLMGTL